MVDCLSPPWHDRRYVGTYEYVRWHLCWVHMLVLNLATYAGTYIVPDIFGMIAGDRQTKIPFRIRTSAENKNSETMLLTLYDTECDGIRISQQFLTVLSFHSLDNTTSWQTRMKMCYSVGQPIYYTQSNWPGTICRNSFLQFQRTDIS